MLNHASREYGGTNLAMHTRMCRGRRRSRGERVHPVPTEPASTANARALRNALAVAHGRLQLTRRHVGNGLDRTGTIKELDAVVERLYRLAGLIDALEISRGKEHMPTAGEKRLTSSPPRR
jgi:hypothetical protein